MPVDIPANATTKALIGTELGAVSGLIDFAGDRDWYRIRIENFFLTDVNVFAHMQDTGSATGDSVLRLYDASGHLIASNDNRTGSLNSSMKIEVKDGTYFLEVGAAGDDTKGAYTITILGDFPATNVFLGDGDDTATANFDERLVGGGGNDNLTGQYILGEQGSDVLTTGDGQGLALGGLGDDKIYGGADADRLYGDAGKDFINGNAGGDYIDGGDGSDNLRGNAGNDQIVGGAGGDRIAGGTDDDTYYVDSVADRVIENAGEGRDLVNSSIDYVLPDNVEDLYVWGDAFLDVNGTGNDLPNKIYGAEGDNVLDGKGGDDYLSGGPGNDTYILGASNDTVVDTAVLSLPSGNDTITSTISRSLSNYTNIENLTLLGSAAIDGTGDAGANVITGNNAQNRLNGAAGNDNLIGKGENDTLSGSSGDDRLDGGTGNDNLSGASGRDTIVGGSGSDVVAGGAGRDVMTGGTGSDDFIFKAVSESGKTASTRDVVKDFTHGSDDIDLSAIDASTKAGGNQTFKWIGTQGFHNNAGELHYLKQNPAGAANDKTIVEGDVNGDGKADFHIELTGLKTLTAGDFIL